MRLAHPEPKAQMLRHRQSIALVCFCLGLAAFWAAPGIFRLDETGMVVRAFVAQIGGPAAAVVCCFLAARRSADGDSSAWIN